MKHLTFNTVYLEVTIIETPSPAAVRWKHGETFIVRENDVLAGWHPASLCLTQLRGYVSADGNKLTWEVDRYTSFEPCPVVPID